MSAPGMGERERGISQSRSGAQAILSCAPLPASGFLVRGVVCTGGRRTPFDCPGADERARNGRARARDFAEPERSAGNPLVRTSCLAGANAPQHLMTLVDKWIRMVATSRLTGHSRKVVAPLILRKTKALLSPMSLILEARLRPRGAQATMITGSAEGTPLRDETIQLAVTSPLFLDVVNHDRQLDCEAEDPSHCDRSAVAPV